MGVADLFNRACVQTAVYWGDPSDDGYGGKTFGSGYPEEILCRWENRKQLITNAQGKEIVSMARVYVLQDLDEEGWLFLGSLDDLDSDEEEDPRKVDGAFEIKQFSKSPEYRSTDKFVRVAYL